MKIKFLAAICSVLLLVAAAAADAASQTSAQAFWKSFKAVVTKKDKAAAAALTRFPLSMPYGMKSVKSKADFTKRWDEIFYGETDAAKCFAKAALVKTDAKNYSVSCGFKGHLDDESNQPILYYFELTKAGWRFVGLDNINE